MKSIIATHQAKILKIFNHLHNNPELSWKEYNTTSYIKEILEQYNCKTTAFDDITGVIGEIGAGSTTVAIRADIDALWQEVDGVFRANHSCGHDAHMAIVLGVLITLSQLPELPSGKIKFIFQPAEEKGLGALKLVEKKVVDDVDYLYGIHLRPHQEMDNGKAAPAIYHGAAHLIQGRIIGEDAHGARPHLGTNAIEVGADLVQLLSKIHLDPMIHYSVKMTKLISGSESSNIIPGTADFSIDLRAQTNEAMAILVKKVKQAITTLSSYHEVAIELQTIAEIAAAEVNEAAKLFMTEAIAAVLGENNLVDPLISTGGEDFHFYTLKKPNIRATMLGLGCDLKPGLHHPKMTFDKEALLAGIEIMANAVLMTLIKENGRDSNG